MYTMSWTTTNDETVALWEFFIHLRLLKYDHTVNSYTHQPGVQKEGQEGRIKAMPISKAWDRRAYNATGDSVSYTKMLCNQNLVWFHDGVGPLIVCPRGRVART